jgi:hypothetical protein
VGPIRDQIRPFTGQVDTVVKDLKQAAGPLEESAGELAGGVTELNSLLNALAYNPKGDAESYLFYLSWLNHNTNGAFLNQDGLGPLRRGLFMYTCFTSGLADQLVFTRPNLATARQVARLPTTEQICPAPTIPTIPTP